MADNPIPPPIMRISSIAPPAPRKVATKADLAFIDAAIQLHQASLAPVAAGPSIDVSNPVACDPVDVAAAVVALAVLAYHVYNTCMIGEDLSAVRSLQVAQKINVAPTVSLDMLVSARNQLARALGSAPLA